MLYLSENVKEECLTNERKLDGSWWARPLWHPLVLIRTQEIEEMSSMPIFKIGVTLPV